MDDVLNMSFYTFLKNIISLQRIKKNYFDMISLIYKHTLNIRMKLCNHQHV